MSRRYTPEEYEAFKSFLSQGSNVAQAAYKAGVSVWVAYKWADGVIPHFLQSKLAQEEKAKRKAREIEIETTYSVDYTEDQVKRFFHLRAEGFSVKESAKMVKVRRWCADGWDKGNIPRFLMEYHNQHRLTDEQKVLTPTKSYIMGVLCGDGWMGGKKNNTLSLQAVDSDFVARFSAAIFMQYGKSVPVSSQLRCWKNSPAKEVFRCDLKSVEIYQDLLREFGGVRPMTETWRIPSSIINGSEEVRIEFARGMFDSEGSIRRRNGGIQLGVSNRLGLEDLSALLGSLGIYRGIKVQTADKRPNTMPMYYISIGAAADRDIFRRKIGFTIRRKQTILEEFTNV